MKKIFTLAFCAFLAFGAVADNDWFHIYRSNHTINTGLKSEVEKIEFTKSAQADTLYEKMSVTRAGKTETFNMADVDSCVIGTNVPTIYIDIENGKEVVQKDTYLNATIKAFGYGEFDDFEECDVTIKGRGNSTWNMDKKPYRLKFEKKKELLGLKKAKSFALIANFIDCTMMRNPIALKLAQMLGLDFTNHFIPVNLVINGTYRGSYMLTEKIGIGGASVDIDENTSVLFELDTNYDEPYKFYSSRFGLPVMVKDPDFDELAAAEGATMTASQRLTKWKTDFNNFEATLNTSGAPTADFVNQMDIESLAKYMLVFNVAGNHEPHHPKSVYMYKTEGGKYYMGPVWDFDWAYTFNNETEGRGNYSEYLFSGSSSGDKFFKAMCRSTQVMDAYKKYWAEFKSTHYPELKKFMEEYAKTIEITAAQNGEKWPTGFYNGKYNLTGTEKFADNFVALKTWIENRVKWLDSATNLGLYQY